ncbi:polymorphic toxin type 44 domain-containing protein [Shewanella sp. Isolate13]|uniref:polymorphic toxin type 44 domain-containing protein n=1 Tax=Shewanella sp. Isolate13 TaxID=2908531 RepID=UPI001EFD57E3|nr:polymorphic toxin type 44 domain-containing protein [Shewanella sp. Isolate13]MCG9732374.1 polymorphic toxin type 44 domain-containing protein [Shewanella sp. Isolate13]
MKTLVKGLLFILFLFSSHSVFASCSNIYGFEEKTVRSDIIDSYRGNGSRTKCVILKGLNPNKTIFQFKKPRRANGVYSQVSYSTDLYRVDGTKIKSFSIKDSTISDSLNLVGQTEIKLNLIPKTGSRENKFTFEILNVSEGQEFSIVMVDVKVSKSSFPPVDTGCRGCSNQMSDRSSFSSRSMMRAASPTSSGTVYTSSPATDVAQCTDQNRPPNPAPVDKVSSVQMSYSDVIRTTQAEYASWKSKFTAPVAEAMAYWSMYQDHKTGGIYDVKSKQSDYNGNADDGNFLYGIRMAAFGFSRNFTERASASYQGIQDYGLNAAGVYASYINFIFNVGDNVGDPEMVAQGWDYKKQVFDANSSERGNSSCVSTAVKGVSIGNAGSGGSGGGSGGTGGGISIPGNGSGGSGGSGGAVWCMVQGGVVQYCWRDQHSSN